jgi:RHS repeat-associated protein
MIMTGMASEWAKDYEGYITTNPKVTTYIGNYFEVQVEGYVQPTGGTPSQPCTQAYCTYFPLVSNTITENISYYYADGQRIAMKNNGVVSYLYGDQLGSVSAVADGSGALFSKTFYHPWGVTRYSQGTNPTDYAYTGQMKEGEIYFYNTRYYDPQLGRFMQADTIVPPTQGTQGFDRFAYINNNPVNGTDPSGHCIDGISTAFCVVVGAMVIGAIGGYVAQVAQNMSAGMSFGDALVTDISATPILQGAAITGGAALGISAGTIVTVGQGVCADGDCTNEGSAVGKAVSDAYGSLSHAAEYGIKTYQELRKLTSGTGLKVHHLIEKG